MNPVKDLKTVVKKIKKRAKVIQRFPIALSIELTNKCNLSCEMCPHPSLALPPEDIEFSLLEKIITELSPHVTQDTTMSIVGLGEPLLYKQLHDAIDLIKTKWNRAQIHMNTNATALTSQKAQALLGQLGNGDRILVSINAATRDSYNELMGKDMYELVLSNTKELLALHKEKYSQVRIVLQILDTKANRPELEKFEETWSSYRSNTIRLYVRPVLNWGGTIDSDNIGYNKNMETMRYPCYQLWMAMAIDVHGNVYPCCEAYNSREKSDLLLGSLSRNHVYDVYRQNIEIKRLNHLHENWDKIRDCRHCNFWSYHRNVFYKFGKRWF